MNNHSKDFKFCEGISEENIRNEMKEIEKKGHEVTGMKIIEIQDKFIVYYQKRDPTQPPNGDLSRETYQSDPYIEDDLADQTMWQKAMTLGKKNWYISIGAVVAVGYYFMI